MKGTSNWFPQKNLLSERPVLLVLTSKLSETFSSLSSDGVSDMHKDIKLKAVHYFWNRKE